MTDDGIGAGEFEWAFYARVDRVVDGDTLDLTADLGFRTFATVRVRLAGVDTAETYGVKHDSDEYARGTEQTAFTEAFVTDGRHAYRTDDDHDHEWPFILRTFDESGKYGRWIGDIQRRSDGAMLTEALIAEYPEVAN